MATDKTNRTNNMHKHKKRKLNPLLFWIPLYIAAIALVSVFWNMPMFPRRWSYILMAILVGILGITYGLSHHKKIPQIPVRIFEVFMALIMVVVTVMMPVYKARVSNVITDQPEEQTYIYMNLYVMADDYKEAHPDIFANSPSYPEKSDELADLQQYLDSTFITELTVEQENQRNALTEVKNVLNKQDLNVVDKESVLDSVAALYNNEGQVLIMNQSYTGMLDDVAEYENFEKDTRILYTVKLTDETAKIATSNTSLTTEPFSIFIGGNDQEGDLSLIGRTDVNIVVTVNPQTHQIAIGSFPRDSYIPNPALGYSGDKLTHLGMQGLQNTLDGLSDLLSINIENYILINFSTYQKIIDAIGGVDVENPYAFGFWDNPNIWFEQGTIHLDGYNALLYVRERKTLPDGDFGRTMHQQIVLKAIINKLISPSIITKFDSLLTAIKGTFLTNLSDDAIYGLCQKQLDENISWNIVNYRVEGSMGESICASSGSTALSVVYPYQTQIQFMSTVMNQVINGEIVTQQEMVDGSGMVISGIAGTDSSTSYETEPVVTPTPVPEVITPVEPVTPPVENTDPIPETPAEDPGTEQPPAETIPTVPEEQLPSTDGSTMTDTSVPAQ